MPLLNHFSSTSNRIRLMLFLVFSMGAISGNAQINPMIPLMVQPMQVPNPLQMMQQAEQIRALQLQNEQAAFQLRQMEEQRKRAEEERRAQQRHRQQQTESQSQTVVAANQTNPILDEWLAAAAPRMGLYPDFEKVVFAPDVSINLDMIRLMSASPLAADIAYYLGTRKVEALAISKMSLPQAARAIDQIESRLKSGTPLQ